MSGLVELLHELFEYNPETGDLLRKFTSGGVPAGTKSGSIFYQTGVERKPINDPIKCHMRVTVKGKSLPLHKVVMMMSLNRELSDDEVVDHVNQNGLDNRLDNLKIISKAEWDERIRERKKSIVRVNKTRPIRIEGDIGYVTLTRGCEAVIDAEDAEMVSKYNWNASPRGDKMYPAGSVKKRSVSLNRYILGIAFDSDQVVTHKNGNLLDCRKANLQVEDNSYKEPWVEGGICYIPLNKGEVAMVDAEDFSKVVGYKWRVKKDLHVMYARRSPVDSDPDHLKSKSDIFLHRIIAETPHDMIVDHINRNGLDNRKSNLRNCSCAENQWNQKKSTLNKSGHKGVYWYKKYQKWAAKITVSRKRHHLGYFDELEDAAKAYEDASRKYHGEYGRVA